MVPFLQLNSIIVFSYDTNNTVHFHNIFIII